MSISVHKVTLWKFPGIWNARIALIENNLKMLQKCQIYLIFISISVHKVTVWIFPGIWNARIAPYVWSGKLLSGANVIYSGHVGMWTLYRPENMLRTVQVKVCRIILTDKGHKISKVISSKKWPKSFLNSALETIYCKILIHFYINQDIAVIFQFFSSKIFKKRISVPLHLFRTLGRVRI